MIESIEKECPECNGKKGHWNWTDYHECKECGGWGVILTEEGEKFLERLKYYMVKTWVLK